MKLDQVKGGKEMPEWIHLTQINGTKVTIRASAILAFIGGNGNDTFTDIYLGQDILPVRETPDELNNLLRIRS